MNVKTLFLVTAVLSLANGTMTLVTPATQLSLYGIAADPGTAHMAQWAGLGSVVLGLLAWFGRRIGDPAAERPFLWILLIYYVAATVLSALGVLGRVVGVRGWLLGAVTFLFALACAFALFRGVRARRPTATQTLKAEKARGA